MQLKTQTLQADYDHVYSADPALDRTDPGWREKYNRAVELSDAGQLPLIEGQRPVVWKLRRLSAEERACISDTAQAHGGNRTTLVAVALALRGVEGVLDAKGEPIELRRAMDRRLGLPALVRDQLEDLAEVDRGEAEPFGELVAELGMRVLKSMNPQKG